MALDKEKALQTALTQIEKQFGKGSIMRLGGEETLTGGDIETISTTIPAKGPTSKKAASRSRKYMILDRFFCSNFML